MAEWFRAHPFVLLLIPMVVLIVMCDLTHWPFDLLHATNVSYLNQEHEWVGVAIDEPVERAKTWRFHVQLHAYKDTLSVWHLARERAYVYIKKDSTSLLPIMGDTIWMVMDLHRPDKLGDFDYATYLQRQGIVGVGFIQQNKWRIVGHSNFPQDWMVRARWIQRKLVKCYQQWGISEPELGTLSALTLGYRENLDDDIQRSFQRAGATHILAVSGLHTGIIYAVLLFILTIGGTCIPLYEEKTKRIVLSLIIIATMWGYALITGMSPSVVRAVIMVSLLQVAYMCYRQPNAINTIAAAAFLILCFKPLDLFSVSFQLSFAAVIAIVLLEPALQRLFPNIEKPKVLKSGYTWVRGLISVSLAAQIGTLPLTLYYFGQTTYYFVLTNLVVIPIATLILWLAFLTFAFEWIPIVGTILTFVLQWLTRAMNIYVKWVEQLPGCVQQHSISLPMVWVYIAAVFCAYWAFKRSFWWFIGVGAALTIYCLLYCC